MFEIRDLGKEGLRSIDGEDFATTMQFLHEQVKGIRQENTQKYKKKEDLRRREVNFEEVHLSSAHLWKERLPKKEYKKLKLKRIRPCQILRKLSTNASEI